MSHNHNTVRVRFAPSPTGHLHIGGLRSALFNWLFAKHNNGAFLIRIEDTDSERSTQEYTQSILDTFSWLQIVPDEPIIIQSSRLAVHQEMVQQLLDEKKVYRCYCTPEELVERLGKQSGGDIYAAYDRYCLNKPAGHDHANKSYVIRFKVTSTVGEIVFDDTIRGPVSFALEHIDDFIIVRSDGLPVYNFVVVMDDAFMRITHVIRGEEHLSNTPKQILLYQACGYAIPQFAHLPVILGSDGSKLSKRDGATSVMQYKADGYLPDALINYLVRLGWSHQDQEIFSRQELIDYFSLDQVGKKGAIFDREKLNWVNSVYIKNSTNSDLLTHITENIDPHFVQSLVAWDSAGIEKAIELYKDRTSTLSELREEIMLVHNGPAAYDQTDYATWITDVTVSYMNEFIEYIKQEQTDEHSFKLEACIKKFAQHKNIKLVTIAQPIRIALLGKAVGPGIFSLFGILSTKEVIIRLQKCCFLQYTIRENK